MFGPPPRRLDTTLPDPAFPSRTHVGLEQRVLARLKRVGLLAGAGIVVGLLRGRGFAGAGRRSWRDSHRSRRCGSRSSTSTTGYVPSRPPGRSLASGWHANWDCDRDGPPCGMAPRARRGSASRRRPRRERYVALARAAEANGSALVVVAHHRDDQAETVLLHPAPRCRLERCRGDGGAVAMTVPWWDATTGGETRTITHLASVFGRTSHDRPRLRARHRFDPGRRRDQCGGPVPQKRLRHEVSATSPKHQSGSGRRRSRATRASRRRKMSCWT
jgi:hypothetical protein